MLCSLVRLSEACSDAQIWSMYGQDSSALVFKPIVPVRGRAGQRTSEGLGM